MKLVLWQITSSVLPPFQIMVSLWRLLLLCPNQHCCLDESALDGWSMLSHNIAAAMPLMLMLPSWVRWPLSPSLVDMFCLAFAPFCSVLLCFALLIYIHTSCFAPWQTSSNCFAKTSQLSVTLFTFDQRHRELGLSLKYRAPQLTRGRHFSSSTTPLPHFTPPPPHHHYHHQLLSRSLRFPWQSQRQHRRLSFHKTQTLPPSCLKKKKKRKKERKSWDDPRRKYPLSSSRSISSPVFLVDETL